MQSKKIQIELQTLLRQHIRLLGHNGCGVTELRTFDKKPLVAYADNEDDIVRLAMELDGKVSGIYIGVQPRPPEFFDKAPNCWKPALSAPESNCACDRDIEFITTCFFDIDVVSDKRAKEYPASDVELQQSLQAANLLSRENGLALSSTVCCSGNGHYVIAPILPISVDDSDIPAKFKHFCCQLAGRIAKQVSGVRVDPVYNLSRVMRLIGTVNRKGQATKERPHRRAHFVTEPVPAKSMALHLMILNTEITCPSRDNNSSTGTIKCALSKIEKCEFIKWCRKYPMDVSEPQWFAMITNLAYLKDGPKLIHDISSLDMFRYDYQQTQRLIERIQESGYSPTNCTTIKNNGFYCPKLGQCQVKAPMFLTHLFSIWKR